MEENKEQLLDFFCRLIQMKSYSTQEEQVVACIREEMKSLGYDEILEDGSGSIIGVIGNGPFKLMYDSHIDTVEVTDESKWSYPPFGAVVANGNVYGRGASDMKASAAASVYAGAQMKKLGLLEGKTVYICCSALEEDFDGEGTKSAILENKLDLDAVVICEPTHLKVSIGQRGRSIFKVITSGISSHGAAPEKGDNAVYKMAEIIARVEQLNQDLFEKGGWHGSVVLSKVESQSVSLNAVPDECIIYLDRRTTVEEDEAYLIEEMNRLVEGTEARWEIYYAEGRSYKGKAIKLRSVLPAWEIEKNHPLFEGMCNCYQDTFQKDPELYRWDFSTNGVATAGELGIPTIGFGAGIEKMAHQVDEYCPIEDLYKAYEFMSYLPKFL